jgi:hypothetical protein
MLVSARYLIQGFGQRITPVRPGADFNDITIALCDLPQLAEQIRERLALCPLPPSPECLERLGTATRIMMRAARACRLRIY